jgi:hypothetical protein
MRIASGGKYVRHAVPKTKFLDDAFYATQLERLSGLRGFPLIPAAQADLTRALRRVSETDGEFIHRLVTQFVDDSAGRCPKPGELLHQAGQWRQHKQTSLGNPACLKCDGTGWVSGTRMVKVKGVEPYEADYSERCLCAPPVPRGE